MSIYLGVDIGGTKTDAAVVTDLGEVQQRLTKPTPAREGGQRVLETALSLAQELMTAHVQGIGIGTGGQVDLEQGMIVSATDLLPGWAGTPVKAAFEDAFGIPASVDNDVNAFAVGEARFGAARGKRTVIFLALGTGVGGALLLDGRVHHGAHWSGGEFGHILLAIDATARYDSGGHQGTLEAYVSGPALLQTWHELSGSTEAVRGEEIFEKPYGPEAVTQTGSYLGYGLVSLVNAFDPDLVVIGGGLAALGDLLLEPARRILRARALPGPAQCPVVTAQLGSKASVIGAAALAMPDKRF